MHPALIMNVLAAVAVASPSRSAELAAELRIEGATIVSPERSAPLQGASVCIRDGRIESVRAGSDTAPPCKAAQVVDGRGLFLVPGLIDGHVHLGSGPGFGAEQERRFPDVARALQDQVPRSYLYHGFTTLVDLASSRALAQAWNARDPHPDLLFCGSAPVADGYPMNFTPKPARYRLFSHLLIERGGQEAPAGLDPAGHTPRAVVAGIKAEGAACVKTYYERGFGRQRDLPVPSLETVRALVAAAHAARLPVFIHANRFEAQAFAVDAGLDVIAHGLWHWDGAPKGVTEVTPEIKALLDRIVKDKVGWQPTLQVLHGELDLFDPEYLAGPRLAKVVPLSVLQWYRSPDGQWFHDVLAEGALPEDGAKGPAVLGEAMREQYAPIMARHRAATAYLARHGARLLFGSDTPSAPTYANPPGLNGRNEMTRLVEAGATPLQVFRAATLANAEALGVEDDLGTVEPGKLANLLLLRADPTQAVEAYDGIVKVVVRGRVLDRGGLAADAIGPR